MKGLNYIYVLITLLFKFAYLSSSDEGVGDDFSVQNEGYSTDDDDSFIEGGLADIMKKLNLNPEISAKKDTDKNSALSCIDGKGNKVDWWFLYKEPDGKRYLSLSSLDVEKSNTAGGNSIPTKFSPLDDKLLIDDSETSPILKTIYQAQKDSSQVWLGWNDQPTDELDAFHAKVCGMKHAHSKGFYAQNAFIQAETAIIGSYAILTSLPQFPIVEEGPKSFGSALKNQLPTDQSKIFGSNLSSKGQHFMCLSLPREKVRLETAENVKEVPIVNEDKSVHLNFLSKYLKTIHPAIIGTNYSDNNTNHFIWRRYFSLLKHPQKIAAKYLEKPRLEDKLLAYSVSDLPSYHPVGIGISGRPVFPLSSTQFHRDKQGTIYHNSVIFVSRWDSHYFHQNGCITGNEPKCLQSFTFQTTSLQSSLTGHLFAKHPMSILDIYDDWATLQVAEAQKYFNNYYSGQFVDRYGLLVQSWIDTKTILPRKQDKKIYDEDGKIIAKIHIDNVAHFHMPADVKVRVDTPHRDHAKWALSFSLETFNSDSKLEDKKPSFNPLVFVADLNRATTQARLKGQNQGRGGGIVAFSSINLWNALMDLNPRSYRQRSITNGKSRALSIQNTLRSHTDSFFITENNLPVDPLRKFTFKSLRLSPNEAKKSPKALNFTSVLNEISIFIRMAHSRSEHAALAAFQRLFRNISEGNIIDAAKNAWERTIQQIKNQTSIFSITKWPQIFTIPSLHIYRNIPVSNEYDDFMRDSDLKAKVKYLQINNETGMISTRNIIEYDHNVEDSEDDDDDLADSDISEEEDGSEDYSDDEILHFNEEESEIESDEDSSNVNINFTDEDDNSSEDHDTEYQTIIDDLYEENNGDYY